MFAQLMANSVFLVLPHNLLFLIACPQFNLKINQKSVPLLVSLKLLKYRLNKIK